MRTRQAVDRLIVSVGVEGSSQRDPRGRPHPHDVVHRLIEDALCAVGLTTDRAHPEHRGDGLLLATGPETPPETLVGPWPAEVHRGLREYNRSGRPDDRLRLRIGMHAGPVAGDGRGLSGPAVDQARGLCDSAAARRVLAAAPRSDLVFVVSDRLYQSVAAGGGRSTGREHYRPAPVEVEQAGLTAWFHVPGLPVPPLPAAGPAHATGNPSGEGSRTGAPGGTGETGQEKDRPPVPPGPRRAAPAYAVEQGRGDGAVAAGGTGGTGPGAGGHGRERRTGGDEAR
ncbi:hypothetical protein [Streptomyces albus]|uniref:hypothetical protein n=1 Tax=Streptomyces albus TaxID=1888 RepID=UPI00068B2CE1|nr:hypothetical protein [Streptomyces albus]